MPDLHELANDGPARFRTTPLPAYAPGPRELRLMTLRSEGQFSTVVYEDEDLYRGNERRDVGMMNAEGRAAAQRRARLRARDLALHPVALAPPLAHTARSIASIPPTLRAAARSKRTLVERATPRAPS